MAYRVTKPRSPRGSACVNVKIIGGRSSRYWCCPGPVRETNGRSSERYQAVGRPASSQYRKTQSCITGGFVAGFFTRRNPMSKASAVWIESMTPRRMGSYLRFPEMGSNLRIWNSRPPRPVSSRSGHVIDSDKLAISPLMYLNQVTMSARLKRTGRRVRCARRKQL